MIIIGKVLSVLLGLTVISKSYLGYRKKQESLVMLLFWVATWLGIMVVAVYPIVVEKVTSLIGGSGSGLSNFLGISLVFLFFITYRVYVKAHRLERQLRDLVIKLGLRDLEGK